MADVSSPPGRLSSLVPRVVLVTAFAAGGAALASMWLVSSIPAWFVAVGAASVATPGGMALLSRRPVLTLGLTVLPSSYVVVWVGAFWGQPTHLGASGRTAVELLLFPQLHVASLLVAVLLTLALVPAVQGGRSGSPQALGRALLVGAYWIGAVVSAALGAASGAELLSDFPGLGRGGITALVQALSLALGAAFAFAALHRGGSRRARAAACALLLTAGATARLGTLVAHARPLEDVVATTLSVDRGDFSTYAENPFTCALEKGGEVLCWGNNSGGRLGDGTTWPSNHPVTVVGVRDAVQIAGGDHATCALRRTGEVVCWGAFDPSARGAAVIPGLPPIRRLGEGGCGLTREDDVVCWEHGPTGDRWSRVVHAEGAVDVAATWFGGCARTKDGFTCWTDGAPERAPCLPPSTGEPQPMPGSLVVHRGLLCNLTSTGRARCWHALPSRDGRCLEAEDSDVVDGARAWALGDDECFIDGRGAVWCREREALPGEPTRRDLRPRLEGAVSIATDGHARFCAVRVDGTAWCWGQSNWWGEIGDGTHRTRPFPTLVRR